MLLDLSRLRAGTEHVERRYEPSAFGPADEDFRIAAPVALTADVRKDGQNIRLVGRVTTALELACSRCLEPFTIDVDVPVDVLYLPASTEATTAASERRADVSDDDADADEAVEQDDLGVAYYQDETIDLGALMREQFYLAVPMKPLCQEACRGLCPICGSNRNRETCGCRTEWVDPRMDALREWRDGRKDG